MCLHVRGRDDKQGEIENEDTRALFHGSPSAFA